MPDNSIVMLFLAAVAVPLVLGEDGTAAVKNGDEVRQEFLEKYAKGPSFAWLKRKAVEARKKKLLQHKIANVQETPNVRQRVKELEKNGANVTDASASILAQNKPLLDFLYQGDLLLPEAEAVRLNFTSPSKQRRAGGIIGTFPNGRTVEMQKWPHDTPICYGFEDGSDEFTMLLARKAFQFWTENSCLTWQEGCVSKPTVKISTTANRGCFTVQARTGRVMLEAPGTTEEHVVFHFEGEQHMSLSAPGCSRFKTATHEAAHVTGMWHEQARPDRDQFIDVVWSSITDDWKSQYDVKSTSQTLGIPYDYGSNMQYTGYANDPKVDMVAKNPAYQHTMGNVVGPIFSDIKFVNLYNDCMCKSGVKCENHGFPHPRDCSKCVCPEGFGGRTCTERQQGSGGAPLACGQTIDANPTWQVAQVGVPAPVGVGPYANKENERISIYAACCHYWIKGNGKRVLLQFDSITPGSEYECRNACDLGATEVKFEDWTRGGARVCCPKHAQDFGSVVSAHDIIIVRVCSLRNTQSAVIRFRTVDNYGPPHSTVVTSQPADNAPAPSAGGTVPKPQSPPPAIPKPQTEGKCEDLDVFCYAVVLRNPDICRVGNLAASLQKECRKSCGLC